MLIPDIHAPFHRLRTEHTRQDYPGMVRNISSVNTKSKDGFYTLLPPLIPRQRLHCGRPLRPVLLGPATTALSLPNQ